MDSDTRTIHDTRQATTVPPPPPAPEDRVTTGGRYRDGGPSVDDRPRVERRDTVSEVVEEGFVSRISGAGVWSGLAVAVAVFILLELLLATLDLVPLGLSGSGYDVEELWWTGGASVLALFVGGLVAGAAARAHRAVDGVLQGVVTWAAVVVALVVLGGIGAGVGFGAFGESLDFAQSEQEADAGDTVLTQDEVEEVAGLAALFLGITVVATAVGGALGSTMALSRQRTTERVRR
jgi:hypothetical protein